MSEFYFLLFTQLDYFVSVSSIRAPYMGCMCGRFPRPVPEGRRIIKRWAAAAAGQEPTGINSQKKECSVPRLPDQPGMLFEWISNSSRNQHWLAMSSGCQVSFLVCGWPQNRPILFVWQREPHLTCLDPEVESSRVGIFLRSKVGHSAVVHFNTGVGGLFILSRLGCTFVFFMNPLKIKFCPLTWWWLWFATVGGKDIF